MFVYKLKFLVIAKITIMFIFFINISILFADQLKIKIINITGEKRISESFILNLLPNYPNTKFNDEVLNQFTKDLYKTGLFSDVNLNVKSNVLEIVVEEHPIINNVTFIGNDLLDNEQLSDIVKIAPRDTLFVVKLFPKYLLILKHYF